MAHHQARVMQDIAISLVIGAIIDDIVIEEDLNEQLLLSALATQLRSARTAAAPSGPQVNWRPDMTVYFLERLCEARNDGRLLSSKVTVLKIVMKGILTQMKDKYPEVPWTISQLLLYYETLRLRHRLYLWMMGRKGVLYDEETGLIQASERQWAAFTRLHKDTNLWLRTKGLPRADLYDLVFQNYEEIDSTSLEASDPEGVARIIFPSAPGGNKRRMSSAPDGTMVRRPHRHLGMSSPVEEERYNDLRRRADDVVKNFTAYRLRKQTAL